MYKLKVIISKKLFKIIITFQFKNFNPKLKKKKKNSIHKPLICPDQKKERKKERKKSQR